MIRRGFSLIELMAATLITSIVVIAAYTLITNSTNSFKDEDARRMLESNLRNAELILQRDLSRIGYHAQANNLPFIKAWVKTVSPVAPDTVTRRFSEFSFIADLTDFESGFLINGSTDGGTTITITLQQSLQIPLTAFQIDALENNIDPNHQEAEGTVFHSAVKKAFTNANAIYVTSTSGKSALFPIVDEPDFDNFSIEVSKSMLTNDFGYSPIEGLRDLAAYPVVVVTYRISSETTTLKPPLSLQRCYNNNMALPIPGNIINDSCQTLIDNLEYFELLPIGEDLNYITQENGKAFLAHNSANMLTGVPQTITIPQLRGFYYMLGAAGTRNSANALGNPNTSAIQQRFSKGMPLEHIQGTSMLTTTNNYTDETTVYTIISN